MSIATVRSISGLSMETTKVGSEFHRGLYIILVLILLKGTAMMRWAKLFAEGMMNNRRDLAVARNYAPWLKEEGCKYYSCPLRI